MENGELYLKLPRRGKSLVAPHKAKPQCGGSTHKRRRSAVWRRDEESRKSQIANRKS